MTTPTPNRKAVVAVTVNLLLIRAEDVDGQDNGPAQDVDAIRIAVKEQLDGLPVTVQERRSLGRPGGEYTTTVLTLYTMTDRQTQMALDLLGLDTHGRPTS